MIVVNDVIKKEESSPSNDDIHDNVMHDADEIPKDPKQFFLKSSATHLLFPQKMNNDKLYLQFGMF